MKKRKDQVVVEFETWVAPPVLDIGWRCRYRWTIHASGRLSLSTQAVPEGEWPHLPRIGLAMGLPRDFERVLCYGREPGENYPDTQEAARFGLYAASVDELFTDYVFPQENGSRGDLKFLSLTNAAGRGLIVRGDNFRFAASRFELTDIDRARHACELRPSNRTVLCLDHRFAGGGSRETRKIREKSNRRSGIRPDHCMGKGQFRRLSSAKWFFDRNQLPQRHNLPSGRQKDGLMDWQRRTVVIQYGCRRAVGYFERPFDTLFAGLEKQQLRNFGVLWKKRRNRRSSRNSLARRGMLVPPKCRWRF